MNKLLGDNVYDDKRQYKPVLPKLGLSLQCEVAVAVHFALLQLFKITVVS